MLEMQFPETQYKELLKVCKLNENCELGSHQISQVFVNAIYWFIVGRISLDDLSMIASNLYSRVYNETTQLEKVLEMCDELSYYIRRIYSPDGLNENECASTFTWFMNDVMKYYFEHKEQVVLLPELRWKRVKKED